MRRPALAAALIVLGLAGCGSFRPALPVAQVIDGQASAEADAYLDRLVTAGPGAKPDVRRLVAQAWPVLPDSLRDSLGGAPGSLRPGAGVALVAWWNGQDPLPVTEANERLVEHLRRVAEAEARFPTPPESTAGGAGYDDRGAVYVRFGEPDQTRWLRSNTLDASISELTAFVPTNALWTYASGATFLFVEDGGGWREAFPLDLLPPGLYYPKVGSGSAEWSALAALALDDFVRTLVLYDPAYSRVQNELHDALLEYTNGALAAGSRAARFASGFGVGERFIGGRTGGVIGPGFFDFVRSEHRRAVAARDLVPSAGPPLPLPGAFPLAVRSARFRGADGSLRVELAWAPEPGAFDGLGDVARVVRSTARLRVVGGRPAPPADRVAAVPPKAVGAGRTTPVATATLASAGARPDVAVQADVLDRDGAMLRHAVWHAGPLAPLAAGPGGLVVSDPLPHLVPSGAARALGAGGAAREAWRYPYAALVAGATVGVAVEAYDLGTEGGRSRYEVERSVWAVRDGRRELVSLSATVSGTSSSTGREFIVLPTPGDVRPGDVVELSGVLRDLVTGRSGEWSLSFQVARPYASTGG
ncbi:GWxTD domain-containing protein [Rubrivirga sp. S365]|uniref:GWxTD domain-containing protein n=1 Tax=Rubrivirga litoralis TaxID=3075598 RepID=A0ABU3BM28_9BACT|nr:MULTISPECIES: GWxTD domain-containing protein [unclassified Rubrivirga]MDT0630276.1 GWxTD domain-containing protein [Rubrivirga sp. F394]MDT7855788.1 GWxTD domain-containing protein [Rubrivirga sp. S365]